MPTGNEFPAAWDIVRRADVPHLGIGIDSGDYNFEACNDDDQPLLLAVVAERARRSAFRLGDDVLHRSMPLPGAMRLRPAF